MRTEIEWLKDRLKLVNHIYKKSEKEVKKKNAKSEWCKGVMSEIDFEIIDIEERLMEIKHERI